MITYQQARTVIGKQARTVIFLKQARTVIISYNSVYVVVVVLSAPSGRTLQLQVAENARGENCAFRLLARALRLLDHVIPRVRHRCHCMPANGRYRGIRGHSRNAVCPSL